MVDLDDTDGVPANEARESDAVGAGPLDPEGLDGAEGDVPCAVETQRQLGSRLRNHL